ncbi:MAG: serine/threonine-protein kinase PknK, partial [Anaerolineae bacterium]|nr:serine/threonine-protein kinase PknK [Anaerolineae bacterium]
MDDLTGKIIKGYELKEQLGAGGFGAVYRAFQTAVRREVAIKVILPEYANHPDFIRRFEAEAQLIARLENLHIVPLYDFWREPNSAYLVMRFLRGGSLRHSLRQHGAWALPDAGRLLDQIAGALTVAHRHGVVHRDLKPDNILLDEEKNAYLADFGIAKDLENMTGMGDFDEGDGVIGSPSYLSPEQIKSQPVTPLCDIYSLGIVLYELLTGMPPFHGVPASTLLMKHLSDPLPDLREIRPDMPYELNEIIVRATAKEPQDRYPDALSVAEAFRQALRDADMPVIGGTTLLFPSSTDDFATTIGTRLDSQWQPENPYKGLRAFQEADAADFFGRATLIDQLLDRLRAESDTSRFLAVVGPSGSGKSSVVKAGLIPSVRLGMIPGSANWFVTEMVPGTHPMEELEAALLRVAAAAPDSLMSQLREDERGLARAIKRVLPADPGSELLLVIDQFEEVFTMVEDETARAHFLNSLLAAAQDPRSRLRIIVTLRADFYDRPLLYPDFGGLISQRTQFVLPLTAEELRLAISGPAERVGLKLEGGLAAAIAADIGAQPGTLPLLQYALSELYERREGRLLTLKAYKESGGVLGALSRRAEEIFENLDEAGKEAARQLFLRLVTVGEGAEDTRRRIRQSEILLVTDENDPARRVIDRFGQYRLLTFDNDPATRVPTVEVAHEALIR